MGVPGSANFLLAGAQGYQIERSLRFNSADSAYLNRTPASAGNRKTWTFSCWFKLGNHSSSGAYSLFGTRGTNDATYFTIQIRDQILKINTYYAAYFALWSTQVFRDPSAWYHLVVALDTTQATASNRAKAYVNGAQITQWSTANYGTQSVDLGINQAGEHFVGAEAVFSSSPSSFWDGYLTEINFIDGQALTPSSFGETNPVTGVWQPKRYSGTYGTNGFYLKFADNSGTTSTTLGKDSSGNGNNWTPNNFSVTAGSGNDSMSDTPTPYADGGNGRGNYCTWNPIYTIPSNGTTSFTNGNLDFSVTQAESVGEASAVVTMPLPTTGKWYWEITPTTVATLASTRTQVGVMARATISYAMATIGADNFSYAASGQKNNNATFSTYGNPYTANDVISVAVDLDNGAIYFAKNGTWQNSGDPTSGSSKTGAAFATLTGSKEYFPAVGYWGAFAANFGQRPFAYTPPAGFLALNTQNLPEPSIKKPSSYMDVVTYTGTGATQTISSLGFSPDLIWTKSRSASANHNIVDAVRGVGNTLYSNATDAEASLANQVTSFDSNGFTLGADTNGGTNYSGRTYAAWCWDKSATPGFDIVTYSGNGTARTIAHSLGVAPSMVIVKNRSAATDWAIWSKPVTDSLGVSYCLFLQSTASAGSYPGVFNSTAPTSSVFSVGTSSSTNTNGDSYVAYLWSEVAGFSKFGSYTGNGSTDGAFVYCGFRPAFVLVKMSSSTGNWTALDSKRAGYNVDNDPLYPNLSNAEGTTDLIDITSNGFKIRTTDASLNTSSGTYIFCAWAESPAKYSLAR